MDYSKLSSHDIEERAISGSIENAKLKRAGFEHRMDRAQQAYREATSDSEARYYKGIVDQTWGIYKKYHTGSYAK